MGIVVLRHFTGNQRSRGYGDLEGSIYPVVSSRSGDDQHAYGSSGFEAPNRAR